MKVLLAVDGSACSEEAVRAVIREFPVETEVRVLHAVEWLKEMPLCFQFAEGPNAGHDVLESRSLSLARAQQLAERVEMELELAGFHPSVSTPDAEPRHAIVDAAREWGADVIVMGSHGRRGFDRLLIGSVAEAVVRHAPCSVQIVRAPADVPRPPEPHVVGG